MLVDPRLIRLVRSAAGAVGIGAARMWAPRAHAPHRIFCQVARHGRELTLRERRHRCLARRKTQAAFLLALGGILARAPRCDRKPSLHDVVKQDSDGAGTSAYETMI